MNTFILNMQRQRKRKKFPVDSVNMPTEVSAA